MGQLGHADGGRRVVRRLSELKARGANVVEVVLTLVAFVALRSVGVVADTPLWIYFALVILGGTLSPLAFARWGRDCTDRQLHFRVALNIASTTAVIYATGWGPMLAIGYMYIASDAIKHSGSRAALPSLVWSPIGVAMGQLAIALNAAPTFLDPPGVHGLAALVALGSGFVMYTMGVTAAEKERAESQLGHVAYHDQLTGLTNRGGFVVTLERAAERARREKLTTALLFLDLDRFKVINDSYGHNVGDRVLVEVASRLRRCVRTEDSIGRFGGDEFTILVENAQPDMAAEFAERITTVLRAPFEVNGRDLAISASVGLAVTDDIGDIDDLLRSADLAMYLAKENGRSRWELFTADMGSGILERYRIAADLRHALQHGDLVTHYQPAISLATNTLVGFEALVRWRHARAGMLPPATFIPVAEESGLILDVDRYVLAQACAQLVAFDGLRAQGMEPLFMSVNVSPASLTPEGADALLSIVAASGVDPTRVQLEITERTAVSQAAASLAAIQRFRQQHMSVVIDDFGTGYSSLDCLQKLPIDGLKIDRGFVADLDVTPTATAIVNAIVTLGHQLGLQLTAEGVETPAQLERLRELGCDAAQGFYFAQPLSAEAAVAYVSVRSRATPRAGV